MRTLTHLQRLEAESIDIMREAAAEAEHPVMLYSIGKDSGVMLHLATKAFYPSTPPFPLLHVDTTWKFKAMYEFRDKFARDNGFELLTWTNQDGKAKNVNPFDYGSSVYTNIMKTQALLQALEPCAIGIPGVNHSAALKHRGELKSFPAGTCAEIQELLAGTSFHESAEHLTALILNFEKAGLMSTESKNIRSTRLNMKSIPGKQSG